jgi:hypothetical protein
MMEINLYDDDDCDFEIYLQNEIKGLGVGKSIKLVNSGGDEYSDCGQHYLTKEDALILFGDNNRMEYKWYYDGEDFSYLQLVIKHKTDPSKSYNGALYFAAGSHYINPSPYGWGSYKAYDYQNKDQWYLKTCSSESIDLPCES